VRAGYANFAIDDPPLKLVLIAGEGAPGSLNHLGVEVFSTEAVIEATRYLSDAGLATRIEEGTTCCFALQDKVWVDGVDGSPWEVYTVLDDVSSADAIDGDGSCCTFDTDATVLDPVRTTACC
jgi:glyoxalase/bleomycin resistance protein/dioxygenase superfamily protein